MKVVAGMMITYVIVNDDGDDDDVDVVDDDDDNEGFCANKTTVTRMSTSPVLYLVVGVCA